MDLLTAPTSTIRIALKPLGFRVQMRMLLLAAVVFGTVGVSACVSLWGLMPQIPGAFLFLFAWTFGLVALLCAAAGLNRLLGRIVLEADDRKLRVESGWGPFRRQQVLRKPPMVALLFRKYGQDTYKTSQLIACMEDGQRVLVAQRDNDDELQPACERLREILWPQNAQRGADAPPAGANLFCIREADRLRISLLKQVVGRAMQCSGQRYGGPLILAFITLAFINFAVLFWQTAPDSRTRGLAVIAVCGIWVMVMAGLLALRLISRRRATTEGEITVDDAHLAIDVRGPQARHYSWERAQIRAIAVRQSRLVLNNVPDWQLCVDAGAKPTMLFTGRDAEDLHWLAETLQRELSLTGLDEKRQAFFTAGADVPERESKFRQIDDWLRPLRISRQSTDNALILQIPPAGLRRINIGLLIFDVLWLAFSSFMFLMAVTHTDSRGDFRIYLTLAPFFMIGIGMAWWLYHTAKATANINLTPESLMIEWTVFRRRTVTIPCEEINDITTYTFDSGYAMKVEFRDGTDVGYLQSFRPKEIKAIAAALRIAMGFDSIGWEKTFYQKVTPS